MLTDESFSKNDLENSLSRKELSPLIDNEDANEQLPLRDIGSFLRKKSSIFSSKSPDGESTPSDEKLGSSVTGGKATKSSAEQANGSSAFPFPPVNGNRESSVIAINQGSIAKSKDAIAIGIEPPVGNINKVPYITVTAPSNEGEHQKLGGTPPHEAMYSRSSNLPSVAITSEYMGNRSFCGDEETIRLNINLCNDKISNVLIDIKSCDDKISLMIFLIYVFNTTFSWCEKKESRWKEELDSYIKEKDELKGELRHLQNRVEIDLLSQQVHEMSLQNQSYTEENGRLREELRSFRESFSTQMNQVSTQLAVPGRDNVFNSPSTHL
ncbi:hypothetical protein NPIL_366141 [Nephila pilipes]|uniref:Uncharacterized protein n=1 Tax=Nephila pilipes TaxID=299642 RepID=A0A8X6SZI6_NEPPI|nr:hypothetical protein NPIL_366141 [Nephila pilipes]